MNSFTRIACMLLLALTTSGTFAQTSKSDPVDWQSRLGTSLTWKLNKKWETEFEYQLRLVNNMSSYQGSYITAGASYNFAKDFYALGYYRLALTQDGNANRFGAGFEYKPKLGDFKLSLRPMVQYSRKVLADDESSTNSKWLMRTRAELSYPISKKMSVYGSLEPFFTFETGEYFIDNIRNKLGLKMNYGKNKKVDVYYMYRPDFAKSYNRTFHVVGVSFDFTVKSKRK